MKKKGDRMNLPKIFLVLLMIYFQIAIIMGFISFINQ